MAGQYNPANSQARMSLETIASIPLIQGATWHDHQFESFTPSNEAETRDDPSIYSSGQAPPREPGKINSDAELVCRVRPEMFTRFFSSAQGKVTTSTPGGATNSRLHKMSPTRSTSVLPTFSHLFWQDDDQASRWVGGQLNSLQFSVSREGDAGLLQATMGITYARGDYWTDGTVTTDAGTAATIPTLFGIPPLTQLNEATATASRVHLKISDITDIADGIVLALVKVGAGAYGAIESTINVGVNSVTGLPYINNLLDSTSGEIIGTLRMPVAVHFPSTTGLAVDDAWYWDTRRAVWSPTYATAKVFNELYAEILIDDEPYCIDDFTLTLTRPVLQRFCIGGAFAKEIRNRGRRAVELELNREYLDKSLRNRLETATSLMFRANFQNSEAIESGFPYYLSLICPYMVLGGRTPGVESQESMTENITATGHPDSTNVDYPDDLTIEEQNSLTSVAT